MKNFLKKVPKINLKQLRKELTESVKDYWGMVKKAATEGKWKFRNPCRKCMVAPICRRPCEPRENFDGTLENKMLVLFAAVFLPSFSLSLIMFCLFTWFKISIIIFLIYWIVARLSVYIAENYFAVDIFDAGAGEEVFKQIIILILVPVVISFIPVAFYVVIQEAKTPNMREH